jgi:hypothetical protein
MAAGPHEVMKNFLLNPHHEIKETFVDTLGNLFFDGQTLRLELAVARIDEVKPPEKVPTGERHVVARLALTLPCTIDLINQIQMLAGQLSQSGLLKTDETEPKSKTN